METNSEEKKAEEKPERSFKEQRIREITLIYYSRPDVRKTIFEFSKNRECVPRYFEGFGKRPDSFQYDSDILEHVRRGATSFHCSEEIWTDPLEISNELSKKEFDEIRIGWDLLIDVDSPYLEYSKIYAELLVDTLKFHGIKNMGVKFSVSGDTDVLIKDNNKMILTPISEAVELIKKGKKLKVLSLDKNRKLKLSKIYDFLEHEDILYEIFHSQSKVPLKATGHHSVFVWDRGDIIEKKAVELKKGDFLISFNSKNNPLTTDNLKVINSFEFSKNKYVKQIIDNEVNITPQLMRLIGYFLSEGHTTKIINQTGFTFNINEKEYIEDCRNILSNLTNRRISIRHPNPNSTQILIHSKEWHDFFRNICGEKKGKHVPYFSWNLSKDLFLEMLRGYIRGDGYKIGEYSIVVKSVSKKLIKEFIWLCKLNNISCSLSSEQNKQHMLPQGNNFKGSFVYILKIPKSELSSLEFNRPRNKLSPYPRDKVFPVDGIFFVYRKIKPGMFNYHRSEQMTLKKKTANLDRIKKVLDWFSEYKTIEEDEECKKILYNYKKLFDSDISVVEVKNIIKKDKSKVYDVSVEETESFFGNDFPVLLHNSGSKGFHIIIPWKAFPKEIYRQKTKDMFPDWPRIICQYLAEMIQPKLEDKILQDDSLKELAKKTGKEEKDLIIKECTSCHRPATKKFLITWTCPFCKNEITTLEGLYNNRRKPKCPDCRKDLEEKMKKEIFCCEFCNRDSRKSPEFFAEKERFATEKLIEADLILVAPRHLFRMPYSLHEKTALASVVIDKDKIKDFDIKDARPFKVEVKSFYPDAKENEARELLLQALDWKEQKEKTEKTLDENKYSRNNNADYTDFSKSKEPYKKISISNPSNDIFPPCIKSILAGIKQDGRKRALFILINFFKSLGLNDEETEKRIIEWNEKNTQPLKKGYIQSQLNWFRRNQVMMPQNCSNNIYKDLGVCKPDELCRLIKNPLNYSVKSYFKKQR